MSNTSVISHFATLPDPRIERTKQHQLIDIITIALCGIICGANDRWPEAWPLIGAELRRQTALRTAARAQHRHARAQPAPLPLSAPHLPAMPRPSPLPASALPVQPPPADLPKKTYRPSPSHPWRQPFLLSTKRQTAHTKPC